MILLVEDNMGHAKLILRSLEEYGMAHKMIHVPNGEAALDYFVSSRSLCRPAP